MPSRRSRPVTSFTSANSERAPRSDGHDAGGVGQVGVGHDRGQIAVDQDHAVHLFAQRADSLRPRVVELRRLPDHDGPAAEDEDALKVGPLGHRPVLLVAASASVGRACTSAGPSPRGWAGAGGRVGVGRGGNLGGGRRWGKAAPNPSSRWKRSRETSAPD